MADTIDKAIFKTLSLTNLSRQEAEELAKSLGIQFNEAGLRAKGFGGLLEEVKTKMGDSFLKSSDLA